jgi:hypothetical protein
MIPQLYAMCIVQATYSVVKLWKVNICVYFNLLGIYCFQSSYFCMGVGVPDWDRRTLRYILKITINQ